MYKHFYILLFVIITISCNSEKINSAHCKLQLELPNKMYLHTGEFQYPNSFYLKQSSFFSADSLIKDTKTELTSQKRNEILSLSSSLLKDSVPLNYGFERTEERTGLLYTLTININNKEKTFSIYDYSDTIKLPKELLSLLKEMLELMS